MKYAELFKLLKEDGWNLVSSKKVKKGLLSAILKQAGVTSKKR